MTEPILIVLQFPLALMVLYLDVLSLGAIVRYRTPPNTSSLHRFAVLIPAHNEEARLPRLLHSCAALDYPADRYDVHVIADNCSDLTALLGVVWGAIVHVRKNASLQGKGYALRWALERLRWSGSRYDGYVIVDADSVLSANFLKVMNRHLARGDQVIQSYDGVLNRAASWSSGLSFVALALFNHLRPRGREALGLSVGLRGNGMCFTSAVLDRFGWSAFTITEDAEFHAHLVVEGFRVRYAAEASVLAEQPTTLHQARSQSVRWERGRLQMLRSSVPSLLLQAMRRRSPVLVDAALEQIVPPLSVLTGTTMFAVAVTAIAQARAAFMVAVLVLIGQFIYVLTGLRLVGAGRHEYLVLLRAPFYVAWKLWTYAIAAVRFGDNGWVRTARTHEDA